MKLLKSLSWLSLIITFTSFPYLGNYAFGPFYVIVSSGLIVLLTLFIFSLYINTSLGDNRNEKWIMLWLFYLFTVLMYAVLMFFKEGTLFDIRRFIGVFFKLLFVISSCFLIIKNADFVKTFLKVNYVIAWLSILLFFLLIVGINIPSITFIKIDGREHYFFFIGASNAVYNWNGIRALRIAGFADEPGAFALMLNYFLCINELTVKKRKYRLVFSFAGVLTFSLAFYLTFIFFLLYWFIKKILNIQVFVGILSLVITLVVVVNSIFPIEALSKIFDMFFKRFEVNSQTGRYEGDNRSEAFDLQIKAIKENFLLGIGDNPDLKEKYKLGNPSILSYLTNYGLYGFIFFLSPIYVIVLKYINRKEFVLILALLVTYLQRPGIEDMFSMLSLSIIFIYSFQPQKTVQLA